MAGPHDDLPELEDIGDEDVAHDDFDDYEDHYEPSASSERLIIFGVLGVIVLMFFASVGFVVMLVQRNAPSPSPAPSPPPSAQPQPQPAPVQPRQAGMIPQGLRLKGPGGSAETLPLGEPAIVNVWLQGCGDCMGSFNAYRDLHRDGRMELGVPIINVAFGRVSEDWAAKYRVNDRLVVDPGGGLVNPMGIRTFTTLVIDADGRIVHKDYPRDAGYEDRVRDALATLQVESGR